MGNIFVGIGEVAVSRNEADIVKTMALGSCVAIIFFAPEIKAAGMAHAALPNSSIGINRSDKLPGYFVDKAIPYLIKEFKKLGVTRPSELKIKLVGGAAIMDPNGTFNIGKRNVLAARKILWKHRLGALTEDVGEKYSRNVKVEVKTGRVFVSSPQLGEWEI